MNYNTNIICQRVPSARSFRITASIIRTPSENCIFCRAVFSDSSLMTVTALVSLPLLPDRFPDTLASFTSRFSRCVYAFNCCALRFLACRSRSDNGILSTNGISATNAACSMAPWKKTEPVLKADNKSSITRRRFCPVAFIR